MHLSDRSMFWCHSHVIENLGSNEEHGCPWMWIHMLYFEHQCHVWVDFCISTWHKKMSEIRLQTQNIQMIYVKCCETCMKCIPVWLYIETLCPLRINSWILMGVFLWERRWFDEPSNKYWNHIHIHWPMIFNPNSIWHLKRGGGNKAICLDNGNVRIHGVYLSLGQLHELKSPYKSIYIYIHASIGRVFMMERLILDRVTF